MRLGVCADRRLRRTYEQRDLVVTFRTLPDAL
jgi:hypothetical protein